MISPAIVVAGLYGLLFGSFANVCIYRIPREKSIVWPRSACAGCGRPIAWFDNVPLFSWLLLLGRCRSCKERISIRYPAVEAAIGAIFALAVWRHGVGLETAAEALLGWVLVVLIFIDNDFQILPDELTIGGLLVGLLVSPWRIGLVPSLIGAAAGGGALLFIFLTHRLLTGKEGLGRGDIKMMAMIGAFLGWGQAMLVLGLSSLAGSVIGVGMIAVKSGTLKSRLPYGVFIGGACLASLYWHQEIYIWLWQVSLASDRLIGLAPP